MRRWSAPSVLALACLAAGSAAAVEPEEFMRPCTRQDLIGVWRVLRLGVSSGAPVDRTDPAFLPHQRYVFHSDATMAHLSREEPFTREEQRALDTAPGSATWALESEGRLVRQGEGVAEVEKSDCRIMTRPVKDPKTSQPTAQAGDLLLTDEYADQRPATRRLLRRIRSAQ
jgi:hypothetical protein